MNLCPKEKDNFSFLANLVFWAVFLFPPFASAQEIQSRAWCQVEYPNFTCSPIPDLGSFVSYLYHLAVYGVSIAVVFIMVREGFSYFLNIGSPAKSKEAKENIYSAFLGLIILLAGSLLINTISPSLNNLNVTIDKANITLKKATPQQRNTTSSYLAIPLGEIISEATLSPGFIKSIAQAADQAEELKKIHKEILSLSSQYFALIKQCKCKPSLCSGNSAPCRSSQPICENCDKDKLSQLKTSLKATIAKQDEYLKFFVRYQNQPLSDFSTPKSSLKQLAKASTLLSLSDGSNILSYYDFLSLRESSGQNIKIEYNTQPFQEWQALLERNPSDPLIFYINKKESENIIAQAQKTSGKNINVDPPGKDEAAKYEEGEDSLKDYSSINDQNIATPSDMAKLTRDYPHWSQLASPWRACIRGQGGSDDLAISGCADTSLSMAVGYWYKHNSIVRDDWLKLIAANPPPETLPTLIGDGQCRRPNGDAPDPYRVLYYMNYYGGNAGSSWDEEALASFLKKINLKFQPLYNQSFEDVVYQTKNLGKSILLFCDTYGYDQPYRDTQKHQRCHYAKGVFTCNHYVLVTNYYENKLIIFDPAFPENSLSKEKFDLYNCGVVWGEDMVFAIFPIAWP